MLASVIERTPEIGIRRALGARRRDITKQFLIESMVLSSVGGVLGILLGVSLAVAVNQFSGIQTVVGGFSILIALGTSASVGVLFGIYPARRAARMSPIEALRHK
jgi:putative ABC transport system permease protein